MIPKKIHLCWFSNDPYPVEIKVCLDTWKRILPDYEVRLWRYDDAHSLGIRFIDEALERRKWAFAADVVRFYAVYTEGGVYMDSDIFLFKRFDEYIPQEGFVTFNEKDKEECEEFGLQAAFFIGSKGNSFCREVLDYYKSRPFVNADGSLNDTISPFVMTEVAKRHGFVCRDERQDLDCLTTYPTRLLMPRKRFARSADTFAMHRVYGSWRKRKFSRRIELTITHWINVVRYALLRR